MRNVKVASFKFPIDMLVLNIGQPKEC